MIAALVALFAASLAAANIELVKLADGQVEVEWARPGSFRYTRTWTGGATPPRTPFNAETVKHTRTERATAVEMASDELRLDIDKTNGRLRVSDVSGQVLLADAAPHRPGGRAHRW